MAVGDEGLSKAMGYREITLEDSGGFRTADSRIIRDVRCLVVRV